MSLIQQICAMINGGVADTSQAGHGNGSDLCACSKKRAKDQDQNWY